MRIKIPSVKPRCQQLNKILTEKSKASGQMKLKQDKRSKEKLRKQINDDLDQ